MKILMYVLVLYISLCSCSCKKNTKKEIKPIGYLDTKLGSVCYYFTTAPGSRGKPKKKVYVVQKKIPVYECYDWSKKYKSLKGQKGHKWYRVHPKKSHWTWKSWSFEFYKRK